MNAASLVSAITIFLNEERFLAEAIESVFAQSYENWELLLVDDGSTDRSPEIAWDYAQRYPDRVRYLEHPGHDNRGMSASRNLGLRQARGEYVSFLDADDIWLPEKLERQIAIMQAFPEAGMVYGRTLIWYSWTARAEDMNRDHFFGLGVTPDSLVEPPKLLIQLIENRMQSPTTCNALMRQSAIVATGGFENVFKGMFEDQVFFMKLCLSHTVFVADACWAKYRQRPDSCSAIADRTYETLCAKRVLLEWLAGYLEQVGVSQPTVWRALNREVRACRYPGLHSLLTTIERLRAAAIYSASQAVRAVRRAFTL